MIVFWILVSVALLLLAWKVLHTSNIDRVERTAVDGNDHGLHVFTQTVQTGGDDGPSSTSHHHVFIRLTDGKFFRVELGDDFAAAWKAARWRLTLEALRIRTGLDLAIDPAHISVGAAGAELAGHRIELVTAGGGHRYVCYRPDGSVAWRLRL